MCGPIDCPICMEQIESMTVNCVTTECGHCFHTNCLMQSVAHRGFGCPYCRSVMAEVPEEDDESIWSDDEEEEEEDTEDNNLRGFRLFWNTINGEEHDEDDENDELGRVEPRVSPNVPSTEFVAEKLRTEGITFETLVKILCYYDHQEYSEDTESGRMSDDVFDKISMIIDNYNRREVVDSSLGVPAPPPFESEPMSRVSVEEMAEGKKASVSFVRILESLEE